MMDRDVERVGMANQMRTVETRSREEGEGEAGKSTGRIWDGEGRSVGRENREVGGVNGISWDAQMMERLREGDEGLAGDREGRTG